MPGTDIKTVINGKPLQFIIKTGNGKWKCQVHSDRASYERSRAALEANSPAPGIARTDSGLSTASTSSSASTSSH
ncbi:hypothetical protein DL769_007395 [Monosporascus sp. CRB-8-3]|nr:hypothetical protein DL769_007395 [Monosporascus sp. CRB-8-3]